MRYSYFPGCSLHGMASEYDLSFKAVCKAMDIQLEEVKDWNCCGTGPKVAKSKLLAIALPVQNLVQVEKGTSREVLMPCASCFSTHKNALHQIERDPDLKKKIDQILEEQYQGTVKISHPLEILTANGGLRKIKSLVKRKLEGLKVVCYYGCLLTRPPKVMKFDHYEYPLSMDKIMDALEIESLDWSYKTECCGASLAVSQPELVLKLCHDILTDAKARGAEAIVTACPLCHGNLDARQEQIEARFSAKLQMPVFYFTQLMGLAFGCDIRELGLHKHLVEPSALLAQKGLNIQL
ncbi:MAG: CoB--CoM heterodisulfide reductase iron-sulfur subunit B family protein [Candidatus Tectomicrobia bacterium]|uniref:CoB--CoM heterodisulfide reductase iron-sulfur subunit B family protein n=1 Tax=Tectimicrobiota bacterium TaxID=2528274 RepID=A0A933GNS9_UNCTE|nr:CoB--CoM heterodisulfide reductase iron-sulfur subunit B family protein [Candidatus Tectomicrobia bacterium]